MHKVWKQRNKDTINFSDIFSNKCGKYVWFWDEAWYTQEQYNYLLEKKKEYIYLLDNKDIPKKIYFNNTNTSGCNISHIYILTKIIDFIKDINKINSITEFGAGYGNLCYLIHIIGYKNKYNLIDLPNQVNIQKTYLFELKKLNKSKIIFDTYDYNCDLFLAFWSLSEALINLRDDIFNKLNSKYIIIGFQNNFRKIDNYNYFKNKIKTLTKYEWKLEKWFGDKNYLLYGKKIK